MNVFVINLYFITSVSPVRAGKQTPVIVDVQKKILNIITNTRRCFVSLSVCAYIKLVIIRSYLYLCIYISTWLDNQWHLLSLSADRAQRYIVFVPGESYFGYIADAFLRAELCPHPPHTLPALVNAVSSWLSHISLRRRAQAAQIQRCRRALDSLSLSERTVR